MSKAPGKKIKPNLSVFVLGLVEDIIAHALRSRSQPLQLWPNVNKIKLVCVMTSDIRPGVIFAKGLGHGVNYQTSVFPRPFSFKTLLA